MDITLVEKLIAALDRSGVSCIEYAQGDTRIVLDKTGGATGQTAVAAAPAASAQVALYIRGKGLLRPPG